MILLFTDFGFDGPYVGEMHVVCHRRAPNVPVVDLMHDAPVYSPRAAGHLLAALADRFPPGAVCCAVVDPGVGTERGALILKVNGGWFVGPDNGLFGRLAGKFREPQWWSLDWRAEGISSSFHGRDVFSPVAAALAAGTAPDEFGSPIKAPRATAPEDPWGAIVYIDAFGNAMTGTPADQLDADATLKLGGYRIQYAETFGSVPEGEAFWYRNSADLVEIAVNQGSAAGEFGLQIGDAVDLA